jgi:hypothetical protein
VSVAHLCRTACYFGTEFRVAAVSDLC